MATKNDEVTKLIERAIEISDHLDGHLKVVHELEVAGLYAYQGDSKAAEEHLDAAEAEIEKYGESLKQQVFEHDYALLKARVLSLLGGKSSSSRSSSKS